MPPQTYEPWNGPTGTPPEPPAQQHGQQPQSVAQQSQSEAAASQQPQATRPEAVASQQAQAAQQSQPAWQPQPAYQAPQVVYAAPPQKKSHGWIVAIVLVVCLTAFTALCVKSCTDLAGGMGAVGLPSSAPANSVAVLNLDGTIQYDGTACSPDGFKSLLDKAADDSNVKALVLRVNSGGGTATAGEEMATYLREFKESSGKPVVVSSASINASAAYEISSQADSIFVAKSTEIGSIGTAMEVTDLSGLLDTLGVDIDVIASSDSKDSTYGYRPLSDEEREYYQRMINQINDMFIDNVATGRDMPVEQVRELATGLVFTGVDAVENGLADEIGTFEDAQDKAAELAGISDFETYSLSLASYDLSSLYDLLGYSRGDDQLTVPLLRQ